LDEQPKSIMLPILQAVRQEGYNRFNGLLGASGVTSFQDAVSEPWRWNMVNLLVETVALNTLTANIGPEHTNQYGPVLGRNACHFAPFSWYRWESFYTIARDLATRAYADTANRAELTYQAWMNLGYADHFLQDSFAAGHLVNKNLIMQWFITWAAGTWTVPVADWDQVKNVTADLQPGLSARELYTGDSWKQIDGGLSQISVGDEGIVWGVNSGGNIYRRDGDS
jgi:hypothetical protein